MVLYNRIWQLRILQSELVITLYTIWCPFFKKKKILSRDFIADLHSAKQRNISWELVESIATRAPKTRYNHNFFSIELKFIDVIRCYLTWSCSFLIPTFNFVFWLNSLQMFHTFFCFSQQCYVVSLSVFNLPICYPPLAFWNMALA